MTRYEGFGLSIESEVALPPLVPVQTPRDAPTVCVRYDAVPTALANSPRPDQRFQFGPGELLFAIDGVARYLIRDGSQILVDAHPDADDDSVAMHLLSTVLSALLHQRGVLVLHGSGVAAEGGAVLFLGHSGSGKSTLAAAFGERGHDVLTDDICAVAMGLPGTGPVLRAGFPYLRLWREAFPHLTRGADGLRPLVSGSNKLIADLPVATSPNVAIRAIYLLEPKDTPALAISPVTGIRRLTAVSALTLRPQLVDACRRRADHFKTVSALVSTTPVFAVQRPRDGCPPARLAGLLAAGWSQAGLPARIGT